MTHAKCDDKKCIVMTTDKTSVNVSKNKNSSGDEIANVNFFTTLHM